MAKLYPMSVQNDRPLPEDYVGPVYIWDVDKTYLSTRFSSMRGLARIPVEFAIDKRAIPGMPEVLRALRRGPHPEVDCLPLYFISASPPFLRAVLEQRMLLDGVEQDGITFKDWIGTLLQLKLGRLWEQVGFKLSALLLGRKSRIKAREFLFGDDTEMDAVAFHLYQQVVNKQLYWEALQPLLKEAKVEKVDREGICSLMADLPEERGIVEKIFIHLEKNTSPEQYKKFGPDLIPVKGGFQLALALFQLNLIDELGVWEAKKALEQAQPYRLGSVEDLLQDAIARRLIDRNKLKKIKIARKK